MRSHFATGLPAAAVPMAFDRGAAKENCGSNFLCITAAAAALQAVLQAPRRGEIPGVQTAGLCEGCISLSNAEGFEDGFTPPFGHHRASEDFSPD